MPGPLVSSAATSALMTTSLGEFPKQTLIAARARVKCGSCPSTSECVARGGSGRWRTWRRWIRTFDSWSRDRQTVMGGGPALETGEDLSGNRKFESISLQRRVCCEPERRHPLTLASLGMQGQRRNKDEEMAGKLRDLQSIYAAVVLAGFGLGRHWISRATPTSWWTFSRSGSQSDVCKNVGFAVGQ